MDDKDNYLDLSESMEVNFLVLQFKDSELEKAYKSFNYSSEDELYIHVGSGKYSPSKPFYFNE